jgi:hypothetical protein
MKTARWLGLVLLGVPFVLAGCLYSSNDNKPPVVSSGDRASPSQAAQDGTDEAGIRKNLAKLGPEDEKLAEAQKYCAISGEELGSMGTPIKITLKDNAGKDQPVFLCCPGCKKDAQKEPAKTLAKVEELKAKAKAEAKQ